GPATSSDPFGALQLILAKDDVVTGSRGRDLLGAYSPGDDTVDAGYGDDFIAGDPGDDDLDGGDGTDALSFYSTVFDRTATKGVDVDAAKGSVRDAWGDRDRIAGFERFEGSRFDDALRGASQDGYVEEFRGLEGSDLIAGRDGWDRSDYSAD